MTGLKSLHTKFLNLLIETENNSEQNILNEASFNSVYKGVVEMTPEDIRFLNQFDSKDWIQALYQRYNKYLYEYLIGLDEKRSPIVRRDYKKFYNEIKNKIKTNPNLSQEEIEHFSRKAAYGKAKMQAEREVPPDTEKLERFNKDVDFEFIGAGRPSKSGRNVTIVRANPMVAQLARRLEGTPGRNDGFDLSNPQLIQKTSRDAAGNEKKENILVTDGLTFPTSGTIRERLKSHLSNIAHGLVEPNAAEKKEYDAGVIAPAGKFKDEFSPEPFIEVATKTHLRDADLGAGYSTDEVRSIARSRALEDLRDAISRGYITDLSGDRPEISLVADSKGVFTRYTINNKSPLLMKHKKQTIRKIVDGVETPTEVENPVLLSTNRYRYVDGQEYLSMGAGHPDLRGREYYDPELHINRKMYRIPAPGDVVRQGSNVRTSGSFEGTRMSPETNFLHVDDPRFTNRFNTLFNSKKFNLDDYIDKYITRFLTTESIKDKKSTLTPKLVLLRSKDSLHKLCKIKILDNLDQPNLFTKTGVNLNVLDILLVKELDRFVDQHIIAGSRRMRSEFAFSDEFSHCVQRHRGDAGVCSYEYDLNTVIDDYINNLHASEAVGTTAAKGTLQALRKNVYNMSQDLLNIFEIIKKLYVIYNQHTNKTASPADILSQSDALLHRLVRDNSHLDNAAFVQLLQNEATSILNQIKKAKIKISVDELTTGAQELYSKGKLDFNAAINARNLSRQAAHTSSPPDGAKLKRAGGVLEMPTMSQTQYKDTLAKFNAEIDKNPRAIHSLKIFTDLQNSISGAAEKEKFKTDVVAIRAKHDPFVKEANEIHKRIKKGEKGAIGEIFKRVETGLLLIDYLDDKKLLELHKIIKDIMDTFDENKKRFSPRVFQSYTNNMEKLNGEISKRGLTAP